MDISYIVNLDGTLTQKENHFDNIFGSIALPNPNGQGVTSDDVVDIPEPKAAEDI
jgi:hypothetical protein